MRLIVDCGSTKADWVILDGEKVVISFQSEGFNPNYSDRNSILSIVLNISSYRTYIQDITEVIFYGSGCGNEKNCNLIKGIFSLIFINSKIEVTHDMMAACHAVLGKKEGVVCILGTGSNSCLYDGNQIIDKTVSLGFILGDEGSGSHLGKTLLRDYFYKKMPSDLSEKIESEFDINIQTFLENTYHKNHVSKYFASFTKFIFENLDYDYMINLCHNCFNEFIDNHIIRYINHNDMEIGFVGSIAYYFQEIIKDCLERNDLKLGKVLKSPIEGLIEYHSHQ